MRILIPLLLVLLGGCAGLTERITASQTTVAKLRAELGADIDLRLALRKDLARKNAQLEYVSDRGYSCGPDNPYFKQARQLNWHPLTGQALEERKQKRIKFIVDRYAPLAAILSYGDALSAEITGLADRKASNELFQKIVTTFGASLPAEFQAIPGLLTSLAKFENIAEDYYFKLKVIELAQASDEPLKKARAEIVTKNIAKQLTELEDEAFKAWDECALDRLFFLREFNPRNPPNYIVKRRDAIIANTNGEGRSPILQFAAEFKTYLDEREAFIGQRADYLVTIDKIVNANSKLASFTADVSFKEFEQTVLDFVTDATAERAQYEAILKGLRDARIIR